MCAKYVKILSRIFRCLMILAVSLEIAGCGGSTPTFMPPATATHIPTAIPTPKPPPAVDLEVSPGPQVSEGGSVAIVLKVEPYEELDWTWEISGTSGGRLNVTKGENVVYTAGNVGVDIIVAAAQMRNGEIVKKTQSMNVVATSQAVLPLPTESSTEIPPTQEPTRDGLTLTTPQNDETVPCSTLAKGIYPLDLEDAIWPLIYIAGRYHPQDEGGRAAMKVEGNWYQTIRFGNCDNLAVDVNKPFQLIIVTANEAANAAFENYFKACAASGSYPGLVDLPPGSKEWVRITVIRE
jgi:predicted small lipoprotein YifL